MSYKAALMAQWVRLVRYSLPALTLFLRPFPILHSCKTKEQWPGWKRMWVKVDQKRDTPSAEKILVDRKVKLEEQLEETMGNGFQSFFKGL